MTIVKTPKDSLHRTRLIARCLSDELRDQSIGHQISYHTVKGDLTIAKIQVAERHSRKVRHMIKKQREKHLILDQPEV